MKTPAKRLASGIIGLLGLGMTVAQAGIEETLQQQEQQLKSLSESMQSLKTLCSQPTAPNDSLLARESRIVDAAMKGEKQFLYPLKGYLYPVFLPEPRFMESLPMQVEVTYLITGKSDSVEVKDLVRPASMPIDQMQVEILNKKSWQTVANVHWFNGHFLAQQKNKPVWYALDPSTLRIKIKQEKAQ